MNPIIRIIAGEPPVERRDENGIYSQGVFSAIALNLTTGWSTSPAEAGVTYPSATGIARGTYVRIESAGHVFYGTCITDEAQDGSSGKLKELKFVDNRRFLTWDRVFGQFNITDTKIINGIRYRRYRHIFPANWFSGRRTWTNAPLTAAEILDYLFEGPHVETPWTRIYHANQNFPVYDLTFDGVTLKQAIDEINEAVGVTTTLDFEYQLRFAVRGETGSITIPSDSDMRKLGVALTENPTRVRVVGGQNTYQVHSIPFRAGWTSAWEEFFDEDFFVNHIFEVGEMQSAVTIGATTYPEGTLFSDIDEADDPELMIAWQLARAYALEITVGQYASLYGGSDFFDFRKFAGMCRNDMPAILYIRQLLFRIFEPPAGFGLVNRNGGFIRGQDLTPTRSMIAAVSHDPATGQMVWDSGEATDGSGYAIIRGYAVGSDLFETLRPDTFDLSKWKKTQDIWQHVNFSIDDSGEESSIFVLFDQPVIRSEDLVTEIDGLAAFSAAPSITVPPVRVAMTFAAERFVYTQGYGCIDDVVSVPSLSAEHVGVHGSIPAEVPYADGEYAGSKAADIATSKLFQPFEYLTGEYTENPTPDSFGNFSPAPLLNDMQDSFTLQVSDGGIDRTIQLSTPQKRLIQEPERDLERRGQITRLFPGQKELQQEGRYAKLLAAALRTDTGTQKTLVEAFRGFLGGEKTKVFTMKPPTATPTTFPKVQVGTPIFRKPTIAESGSAPTQTRALVPADTDADATIFCGVTSKNLQELKGQVRLATGEDGFLYARVMGPIAVGDSVGASPGNDYLTGSGTPTIGTAQQAISSASAKLIRVKTGGEGGGTLPTWL